MKTLILNKSAVKDLLQMPDVIKVVEEAFGAFGEGKANMPPKSYLVVERGDFRAMPAVIPGAAGIKWVNVHPQNPSRGLPTIMAVIVYSDPETGYPLAIMDATDITAYRTGATAAIASKYLARSDPRTLGIIGAGRQAYTQLLAHLELFNFEQIRVFDRTQSSSERLVNSFPGYPLKECSLEEAAASDIVCTQTPSRVPVLKNELVLKGTHINALGADAEGKEELEPAILRRAVVVVDDLRQASGAGEINVPISKGLYTTDEVYANLAEIVTGKKPGRTDRDAVTVFDSTGLAIEDIATARLIYEKARQGGAYISIDLV
ncbi:MAG: ornithine cyclodeaminase family protein [Dehalococcoidales bacterium]|nr:ornithine cyclodeaminase family protein [Dehalococcoidales bacterium]